MLVEHFRSVELEVLLVWRK